LLGWNPTEVWHKKFVCTNVLQQKLKCNRGVPKTTYHADDALNAKKQVNQTQKIIHAESG